MVASTSNKHKHKVGILLATYNQGEFLEECLESLKKQTFQDFKIILVDDASSDNKTTKIIKKLDCLDAEKYFLKNNSGINNVVRLYLPKLETEYAFVLCADDIIKPTYIEKCVNFLDNNHSYAAVATYIQKFGGSDELLKIDKNKIKLPDMLVENYFLGSSMARMKAFSEIGYGNESESFRKHNDYDRWVSMLEKDWKLGVIEEPLFFYRILSSSLSKSIQIPDEMVFQRAFVKKHRKLFEKYGPEIALYYKEKALKELNWIRELQEGRDWLEKEYHRLLDQEKAKKTRRNRFL